MEIKRNEPIQHRMNRKAKKAWIRVLGMAEKSEKMVRIKIKEHELHERKKRFGVEYIDLLNNDATPDEIESYMQTAKSEIAVLEQHIAFLRLEMSHVNDKTNEKLHRHRSIRYNDSTQQQQFVNHSTDPTIAMQKAQFPEVVPEFASTIPKDPPQAPPINPFIDVDEPKYVSVSTPLTPSAPVEHDM